MGVMGDAKKKKMQTTWLLTTQKHNTNASRMFVTTGVVHDYLKYFHAHSLP